LLRHFDRVVPPVQRLVHFNGFVHLPLLDVHPFRSCVVPWVAKMCVWRDVCGEIVCGEIVCGEIVCGEMCVARLCVASVWRDCVWRDCVWRDVCESRPKQETKIMKQLHEKGERVLPESTVAWSTAQVPIHRSPPISTDLHRQRDGTASTATLCCTCYTNTYLSVGPTSHAPPNGSSRPGQCWP
jgi:hypothetical protein